MNGHAPTKAFPRQPHLHVEFDKEQTLARALELFWSREYGATPIQDLVDAPAVEPGSLYGPFADKRRLYLDAVRLYWEM
ncbi:TetR/AcrR family transcriptional regulator [Streptomyces sp. NBC_01239]|uniref:TetR family transcriptional regulator n=1 Tax=Streptomyces sp. NBC_01239 TaxID=2903792 RepID=UPI00225B62AF|nr:TetR family transcriptional regulator [Streptomyces sp. NBC_01239]MCX4818062.1 TetR/AcrR family transcriptional regulator [Streptomyces sp. NBC_01239]